MFLHTLAYPLSFVLSDGIIRRVFAPQPVPDGYIKRAAMLTDTLDRIIDRKLDRVERRIEGRPELQDLTLLLRDLAYGGDIARAELEVSWASEALERLARFTTPVASAAKN